MDLLIGDAFTIVATTAPEGLNVSYVPDDSGVYSIDEKGNVIGLRDGEGSILVKVGGDGVYAGNFTVVNVTVSKVPTEINVVNDTLVLAVGDEIAAGAALAPAEAGNVTYSISNSSVVKVEDGKIIALAEGEATITVSFDGDSKYIAAENKTITVTVKLNDAKVTAENIMVNVNENKTIGVMTTPDGLKLIYESANSTIACVDATGKVTGKSEGTTTITITIVSDGIYYNNKTTIGVTVRLNDASVTADDLTLDVYANATISPITSPSGLEVEYASGNSSIAEVDANGVVTGHNAGNTTITITTKADGIHAVNSTTINVFVNKIDSTIDVNDTVLDYGETTKVNVTFDGAVGITAKLNDEEIIFSGDSVPISVLDAGTYNLTVTTIPDGNHNQVTKTVTVTVLKENTTFDIEMPANITAGEQSTVNVKLPDDATGNVAVKVDGTVVDNATVTNGTANLTIPSLNAGNHTIEVIYSGDGNHNPANETTNVTVKKATPKITAKAKTFKTTTKTKKYTMTLKDNNGNAIKNTKVYLKVNGVTYSATTNSKGQATFKITKLTKKGKYNAVITYKGNKYYDKVTKKVKITVKPVWKTVSKGSKDKATVKKIQKALKKNGYYLTYKGHYLKVDGIYHDCTVRAVKQFQKANGLKVTGKVDEKTAIKLKLI